MGIVNIQPWNTYKNFNIDYQIIFGSYHYKLPFFWWVIGSHREIADKAPVKFFGSHREIADNAPIKLFGIRTNWMLDHKIDSGVPETKTFVNFCKFLT